MEIIVLTVIAIALLTIIQFYTNYDRFLYKVSRMKKTQLEELELRKIKQTKDLMYVYSIYEFRKIKIHVKKRRFSLSSIHGTIEIRNGKTFICDYRELSKKFKSQFYIHYLEVRYPRTLAYIPFRPFKSEKVKDDIKPNLSNKHLLVYEEKEKHVSD